MNVMCRNLISVDWRGYLYDCDFNQQLGIELKIDQNLKSKSHLRDLLKNDLSGNMICVANHCYGCTAAQGSSCNGALFAKNNQ